VLQHQCPAESLRVKKSLRVKNCANGQDRPLVGRPLGANLAVAIGLTSIRAVSSCDTVRKGKRQWSSLLGRRSRKTRRSIAPIDPGFDFLVSACRTGLLRANGTRLARETWRAGWMPTARSVAETSSQENCPTVQLACLRQPPVKKASSDDAPICGQLSLTPRMRRGVPLALTACPSSPRLFVPARLGVATYPAEPFVSAAVTETHLPGRAGGAVKAPLPSLGSSSSRRPVRCGSLCQAGILASCSRGWLSSLPRPQAQQCRRWQELQ
jgi:hypothetical protein